MTIDCHTHVSRHWYEPLEVLLTQMALNDVSQAVLVQLFNKFDNEYQADCVRRHPRKFVSVVCVDPRLDDPAAALAREKERDARGVRLFLPSRGHEAGQRRLWDAAARLGLPVSVNGTAAEIASEEFEALVRAYPDLPILIEHVGVSNTADRDGVPATVRRRALALARFANLHMKIHGLGEFATRAVPVSEPFAFVRPVPAYIQEAYDAFGARRLMWGSLFPGVSQKEGYRNALHWPLAELGDITQADRDAILGGTAARIYGMD